MRSDHYSLQRAVARDQNHDDRVVMVNSNHVNHVNPARTTGTDGNGPVMHSPNGYENPTYCDEPGWRYVVDLDALEVLQVHNPRDSRTAQAMEVDPHTSQPTGSNSDVQRTQPPPVTHGHGSENADVHNASANKRSSHEIATVRQERGPHHTASESKHAHTEYQSEPFDQFFTFSSDHVRAYLHEQKGRPKRNRESNYYEPIKPTADNRHNHEETPMRQTNKGTGKSHSEGEEQKRRSHDQYRPKSDHMTIKDPIYDNERPYQGISQQPSPCFRYRMNGNPGYEKYDIISNHKVIYNHGQDNHGFQSADVSVDMNPRPVAEYMVPNSLSKQEPAVIYSRRYDQANQASPVKEKTEVLLNNNMDTSIAPRDIMNVPQGCRTNVHDRESEVPHRTERQNNHVYPQGIHRQQRTGLNINSDMAQVHSQNNRPPNTNSLRNTGRVMIDVSQNTFKKIARQLSNPAGQSKNYDVALPVRVRKPSNHSDLALFSCICCLSPFGIVALVMAGKVFSTIYFSIFGMISRQYLISIRHQYAIWVDLYSLYMQ